MEKRNHKWSLHDVVKETPDAITIYFTTGDEGFSYLPGQFINVTADIEGTTITRSYSLSSSPREPNPSITVKRVAGGLMSNYLFQSATEIREWNIEGPFGSFVLGVDIPDHVDPTFTSYLNNSKTR